MPVENKPVGMSTKKVLPAVLKGLGLAALFYLVGAVAAPFVPAIAPAVFPALGFLLGVSAEFIN